MGIMTIDGRKVEFTDEKNVLTVTAQAQPQALRLRPVLTATALVQ